MMRVIVTTVAMHIVTRVHVVPSMHVMTGVPGVSIRVLMFTAGLAALVIFLSLTNEVVLLVTLALVRRAVALTARVVIATAHRSIALVTAVLAVVLFVVWLMTRVIVFVHLLLVSSVVA